MKPIGSEKIENTDEKLKRILELAGIKKNSIVESSNNNISSNILHEAVAADGMEYAIVQEEKHVYIKNKKPNSNEYTYISGIENIKEHSYSHYADALKHLNFLFKQINENVGQTQNIDLIKKKV